MSCEAAPRNFFSGLGFRVVCAKTPNLSNLVQKANVPAMNLGTARTPTPFVATRNPGNMEYNELIMEFKLDENLVVYDEILDWMEALGHPDNLNPQYNSEVADLRLIVLNSSMNPIRDLLFTEAYPTLLSEIPFDSTLTDVPYVSCTVSFQYQRMIRQSTQSS
tara:strand:- start:344 stop:832 length:489 start_codon:yes stop_codon:yes gene_type:complete